jgi:hypothetical protein
MTRLLALILLALSGAGCRSPEGPADRYRRFAEAARTGRADAVWAMLSERSRRSLDDRAAALSAQAPAVARTGRALVLGDLAPTAPSVRTVAVLTESEDRARVAVEDEGGGKGEVSLVREGGEWRVELPGS